MKLLKCSLVSILSVGVLAYSDATCGWTIQSAAGLKKPCFSAPHMKKIKKDLAHYIEHYDLPLGEGTKFSDVNIKGLRFDNQGPSNAYPEHTLYQIQYGSGIGSKNKDDGGCYAAAVIQNGAPNDKSIETMHKALDDPKHQYRLFNATEKKDDSRKKTAQSNTNSEPRVGLSKSEKQALAKMLSKKSEKRELVKTQQQFMEESIESIESMETEQSMGSEHLEREDTFQTSDTNMMGPQQTTQKRPTLRGKAQQAQEEAAKILNQIMPNVPKRAYYTKFYEQLEQRMKECKDGRLYESLRKLGHELLENALENPVEPGKRPGTLYGWKSSFLFWMEASEEAQKHVRKVFE